MSPAIASTAAPSAPLPHAPMPSAPGSQGSGFAQLLSAQQGGEPALSQAPAHAQAPAQHEGSPAAQTPACAGPKTNASEARTQDKKAVKTDTAKAPRADAAKAPKAKPAEEAAAEEETAPVPTDPALVQWLSAHQTAPTEPALNAQAAAPAVAAADAAAASARPAAARRASGREAAAGADGLQAAQARRSPTEAAPFAMRDKEDTTTRLDATPERRTEAREESASSSAAAWQAAVERASAPADSPAGQPASGVNALAGTAPAGAVAHRGAEVAAPVAVAVATPVNSPEFPQSLGVQVSVLAKDGVQQAELHLNPADMGPISVQISLEGTQAQVNFGADLATTRQIIEGGLPELASALRDAGFTLSGGGVHSQAQGRREGGGDASGGATRGGGAFSPGEESTVQRVSARVAAGGVDVYA